MFDEQGTRRDKFPTKPAEKGQRSYVVRALAFSPDNQKLCIAQSDNSVFIYRVGLEWDDRKTIINKYSGQSSSVTCLTWPNSRPNDIIFGLAEGKVRRGYVKKQYKSGTLYTTNSYVVAVAPSVDGQSIISGHLDFSIIKMNIETNEKVQICAHTTIPYALSWGTHIAAAGNDGKLVFYDENGGIFQKFDYGYDAKVKEFTCAAFNPSGESLSLGNYNRFYVYNFNSKRGQWDEVAMKHIENLYSVTSLSWKSDGSKIVIGSLCGSVDMFDISMKKTRYKGKFEFTYVSHSQVIVKKLSNGDRTILKSAVGGEISKIDIFKDRFIVGHTYETLLLGDIDACKLSEIPWRGSGKEKYDFSSPGVCMIFNAGELLLVEYGMNETMGTCRTEYLHPSLISARLGYKIEGKEDGNKVIAYLFDLTTIRVQDLSHKILMATISHDTKIDKLTLNPKGNKLLFKDKKRQLYLFNLKEQKKTTLLNYCDFVAWVPDSDVVVAQNRDNLCVWYSIEEPDKMTMYSIKGDVEDIERTKGKTEVIVDDGTNTITYALDEGLIAFGTAMDRGELTKAVDILDPLELTTETEANWKTLAKVAVDSQDLLVAERCYAALGNVPKANYLRGVNKLIRQYEEETKGDGYSYYLVQARLATLNKDFSKAEVILLNQNEVEEAMMMYQELHKWDESIKVAEKRNHPEVKELKANYLQWLLETKQEAKAAQLHEDQGDYMTAISLYLKGGLPARAAAVVNNYNVSFDQDILERIASELQRATMFEKAGDFFEKMDMQERSLASYIKGHAYHKAVDLAKRHFPQMVVQLEDEWGDWLVAQKQVENAVNHYKEAGAHMKAIEACIASRQWSRAVHMVQTQSTEIARPFYEQIAKHYADVRQLDLAEKYYVKAGRYEAAFEMYIRVNKWEQAYNVIDSHLPETEVTLLYIKEAQKLEKEGHMKEAERMYLTVNEPDLAINMYKKCRQTDHMIRLVTKYRRDLLKDTHRHLAQQYEMEVNLKQGEHHYIEGGAWHGAVDMYKAREMWEEAIRVAKSNGTAKEVAEIGKKWAKTMEREAGVALLLKLGLADAAIDFLADEKEFMEAFRLSDLHAKYKSQDVCLKYAMSLEDDRRFKDAEEYYIKANKPTEAIQMYQHNEDWHSALQVARQYYPEGVTNVFLDQGQYYLKRKEYAKAETAFINGKQPEMIVNNYMQNGSWTEALRVAKKHCPLLAQRIHEEYVDRIGGSGGQEGTEEGAPEDLLTLAKMSEENGQYRKAISLYLQINESHYPNPESLERIWMMAVDLAMNHEQERAPDVVTEVGKRLTALKRYESAGDLYETMGYYREAVESYIVGMNWKKAREVAHSVRHTDFHSELEEIVETAYRQYLIKTKKSKEMEDVDLHQAIRMKIDDGEWEEALTVAAKGGPQVLNPPLLRYTQMLLHESQFKEAAGMFIKFGAYPFEENLATYKTICLEILAEAPEHELAVLKDMLQNLCQNIYADQGSSHPHYLEFNKYLIITHFLLLKSECDTMNINTSYSRLCISLLRYTKEIRPDKAFHDAGLACKSQKIYNMAFIFLNRYLDLADAIEDPQGCAFGDNQEFENSDIPSPYDITLPEKNMLSAAKRDEIKDWVLQVIRGYIIYM